MAGDTLQDNPFEVAFNRADDPVYKYRFYYRGVRGLLRPVFEVASKYDDTLPDRYLGMIDGGTPRYVSVDSNEYDSMGKAALILIDREFSTAEIC